MCSDLSLFVCTNAVSLDIYVIISARDSHSGSSLPLQYSSGSDPHPMAPTQNVFIYLFWCTPAWSRVQALLFSNIICKGIALSFFLPMVCIHVCHVFQVGHTMPSREREAEAECSRCVA